MRRHYSGVVDFSLIGREVIADSSQAPLRRAGRHSPTDAFCKPGLLFDAESVLVGGARIVKKQLRAAGMGDARFLTLIVAPGKRTTVGERKVAEECSSYRVALRCWNDIPRVWRAGRWVPDRDQRSGRGFGLGKVSRSFERR